MASPPRPTFYSPPVIPVGPLLPGPDDAKLGWHPPPIARPVIELEIEYDLDSADSWPPVGTFELKEADLIDYTSLASVKKGLKRRQASMVSLGRKGDDRRAHLALRLREHVRAELRESSMRWLEHELRSMHVSIVTRDVMGNARLRILIDRLRHQRERTREVREDDAGVTRS